MPMSAALADTTLTAAFGGTVYAQLHTASPGAAGTANVAEYDSEPVDRKAVSFDSVENHPSNTERRVLTDAPVGWTGEEIDAAQTISDVSFWSAAEGGNLLDITPLIESKITGSDGIIFSEGQIEIAYGVFAKPE